MLELTSETLPDHLVDRGHVAQPPRVTALAWGVSNAVFMVTAPSGNFVVKQSRGQLRTKAAWFSRLDRIYREVDVMRAYEPLLPAGVIPRILAEDRENFLFLMSAAPADHIVWKQSLLEGDVRPDIARTLGKYLAALHAGTARQPALAEPFADIEVFDQLRIDPFYRSLARKFPHVAPAISDLIDEQSRCRCALVHADFSPKNVLVHGAALTLVDFETGHWGDPAFDLGFFCSHLILKSARHADRASEYTGLVCEFLDEYRAGLRAADLPLPLMEPEWLLDRSLRHLGACLWARLDGTSPVDYLDDSPHRDRIRELAEGLLMKRQATWEQAINWH